MTSVLFLGLMFGVALLYSSVGHGGASGYLALMSLFTIDILYMKASALTLNLFVSGIALFQFTKAGYFRWRIILPFIISSIPMAFAGAMIKTEPFVYKLMLGVFLLFAVFRIVFFNPVNKSTKPLLFFPAVLIGAILGFLSGMIGIGGGIILSPVIILLRWASIRETAAVSALFILVNSVSGLAGVYLSHQKVSPEIFLWVLVALAGGLTGAWLGSRKLQNITLRYILSGILLMASFKLFYSLLS